MFLPQAMQVGSVLSKIVNPSTFAVGTIPAGESFQFCQHLPLLLNFITAVVPPLITFQGEDGGSAGKNGPEVGIHAAAEMIEKKECPQVAQMCKAARSERAHV